MDEIWMGDETPDKITSLQIVGKDGTRTVKASENAEFKVAEGDTAIILEAEDAVGNSTGPVIYKLTTAAKDAAPGVLSAKALKEENVAGKGIGIGVVTAIVVGAAAFGIYYVVRKKNDRTKD